MNTEESTKDKRYGDLLGTCSRCSREDYAPLMFLDLQDAYEVAAELKFDRNV